MARIETHYNSGGFNYAIQYINDLGPKRCRVYFCTATNELVVRPRVTSKVDSLIVHGTPPLQQMFPHILATGIAKEYLYIVDHVEWSEDRATIRT